MGLRPQGFLRFASRFAALISLIDMLDFAPLANLPLYHAQTAVLGLLPGRSLVQLSDKHIKPEKDKSFHFILPPRGWRKSAMRCFRPNAGWRMSESPSIILLRSRNCWSGVVGTAFLRVGPPRLSATAFTSFMFWVRVSRNPWRRAGSQN